MHHGAFDRMFWVTQAGMRPAPTAFLDLDMSHLAHSDEGLYLVAFSIPALVATVQRLCFTWLESRKLSFAPWSSRCGILRNGFENWPMWLNVELWLGVLTLACRICHVVSFYSPTPI